jgi:type IV pilus assembly protein PilC
MLQSSVSFAPMQEAIYLLHGELEKGHDPTDIQRKNALLDDKFFTFMKIGMETGKLAQVFSDLETYYAEKTNQNTAMLNTVLEPLLIIFVGLIVALILVAMYMPMFEMSTLTT